MKNAVLVVSIFLLVFAGCINQSAPPPGASLSTSQAMAIANSSPVCMAVGSLAGSYIYNNLTMTWWFDLNAVKVGCSPACVVYDANQSTEVNWRCTGAVPPAAVAPLVSVSANPQLGQILVGRNGMTLYVFLNDQINKSTCYGTCASIWPPLIYAGSENLSGLPGDLGTIARTDGSMQVTYNGMPLYYFAKDKNPGDILGQYFLNIWFVAKPDMMTFPAMTSSEAITVAKSSPCMTYGNLTSNISYNLNTSTWWINLDTVKAGCSPACVVYENRTADVNWRCTGLVMNQTNTTPSVVSLVPAIKMSSNYNFGEILTTSDGKALYVYNKDVVDTPTCTGACADAWPPLFLGAGYTTNGTGLPGLVSTVAWQNGSRQVTYNGMPLYIYSGDTAGMVNGNGIGGTWYVATPQMNTFPVTPTPSSGGYGGGY